MTRIRCPARSAWSAVRPTAPAGGSQKNICGTACESAVTACAPTGAAGPGAASRRLEPLDAGLAREMHLESLVAAMSASHLNIPGGVQEAAQAACAAPP